MYSMDFSLSLPSIDLLHCGVLIFSKDKAQRFLTLPVSPPGLQYFLTRRFVHWMWLPPERNHLLSDMFWVIIRNYVHLFWKLEVPPWHFWTWYVSLFPNGNLRPTWLVQLLGGSQINRNLENPNLILVLPSCSLVGFTWSSDGLRIWSLGWVHCLPTDPYGPKW